MVTTNAVPIGQRIGHQQPHEQLEHVLFDSPQAKAFWKLLLPHWARCTPTQSWAASLAASGVADRIGRRAIALGVRPDGEAANQEQWDALRAVAIDALLAQHRANAARVDAGHPPLTAAEAAEAAFAETRAELQKIVVLSHRVAQARTQFNLARPHRVKRGDVARSADAWHDAWIASGLATIKGKPQQCILPPPPSVRPCISWLDCSSQAHLTIFGRASRGASSVTGESSDWILCENLLRSFFHLRPVSPRRVRNAWRPSPQQRPRGRASATGLQVCRCLDHFRAKVLNPSGRFFARERGTHPRRADISCLGAPGVQAAAAAPSFRCRIFARTYSPRTHAIPSTALPPTAST